jgi:lipopolysaccharide/colanic/teichoic acid biosynthesis glycosyltransferase
MKHTSFNLYRQYFKRLLDISLALLLLAMLSPLFLVVALALKIENPRAPVFYTSKRVGQFYRIFGFLKFRSMRPDADKLLASMQHLNQYAAEDATPKQLTNTQENSVRNMLSDEGWVDEHIVLADAEQSATKTFVKISNDPRITRVGHFIRNTSIDELPQLWNVVRGEMSLVGNRPLPLYEAEQLTTDEAVARFMAPAGITGLWQVTERGKSGVSANSRKMLDASYAQQCSFLLDMWILIRTPLAALQSDNV